MTSPDEDPGRLTPAEAKARGRRNVWLALALLAFVALVAAVTMIRLGAGVPERM